MNPQRMATTRGDLATSSISNRERYTELLCVSAQVFQLDAGTWRELTKDFILLHIYYDCLTNRTNLIALDGVKLIIKDFTLSPCLSLLQPTKKFVHFVSSVYGRSEMYGFGLQKAEDATLFMNQVNRLSKKLPEIYMNIEKAGRSRPAPAASYPTAFCSPQTSFRTPPSMNPMHSMEMIWRHSPLQVANASTSHNNGADLLEDAFQEMSLSDDDFGETALPSVLGALDDVFRTPTKQYLKDNQTKNDEKKELEEALEV